MKNQYFFPAIAALALGLVFAACHGKDDDDNNKPGGNTADVYVVGEGPMLWKNGAGQRISNHDADAFSVFVSGNDVYAAGVEYTQDTNNAVYWKNGAIQRLSSVNYAHANSIFVSGGNVYVVGYETDERWNTKAILWVNGQAQRLIPFSDANQHSWAFSVYVSGNDVYVAGAEGDFTPASATLWKNGAPQRLGSEFSFATSVFVSDGNVYVAESGEASRLWKNGAPQILSGIENPTAVFVSGSDIYVLGHQLTPQLTYRAVVWKNGFIQNVSSGNREASGNSLFVSGNDVYVAGWEENTDESAIPTLWKNGQAQRLTTQTPDVIAYSVYVAEKEG